MILSKFTGRVYEITGDEIKVRCCDCLYLFPNTTNQIKALAPYIGKQVTITIQCDD